MSEIEIEGPIILDTNALVGWWRQTYPPDLFDFWDALEELARNHDVRVHDAVYVELERQNDGLCKWMNDRRELFYQKPTDDVERVVALLVNQYRNKLKLKGYKNNADPYVIALAKLSEGALFCDERTARERMDGGDRGVKYRIPDICRKEQVPCYRSYELLRMAGWRFERVRAASGNE